MAIALVQEATIVTGTPWSASATATISFSGNATVGNFIAVVFTIQSNRSVVSVTDDGSNTYATDASLDVAGPAQEIWTYWAPVTGAGDVISIQLDTTNSSLSFIKAWEFSGLNNADLLEDLSTNTEAVATTTWDSGAVTTTIADSLIVGILSSTNNSSPTDDDYTSDLINQAGCDGIVGYKILTATEASEEWNCTFGGGGTTGAQSIAAFNGSVASGQTIDMWNPQFVAIGPRKVGIVASGITGIKGT